MRILILSDSHGFIDGMAHAVTAERPDVVIHLGDCWDDSTLLRDVLPPKTKFYRVAGNCDRFCMDPALTEALTLNLDGVKFFLTHGHRQHVKEGYYAMLCATREMGARVGLFGHTHQAFADESDGVLLMNPGACGSYSFGTYGMIEVENGSILSHEICTLRSLK